MWLCSPRSTGRALCFLSSLIHAIFSRPMRRAKERILLVGAILLMAILLRVFAEKCYDMPRLGNVDNAGRTVWQAGASLRREELLALAKRVTTMTDIKTPQHDATRVGPTHQVRTLPPHLPRSAGPVHAVL